MPADSIPESQRTGATILLVQTSKHNSTRFYQNFAHIGATLQGLLRMYETRLREVHLAAKTITYDVNSLMQYLDDMVRFCVMCYTHALKHDKRRMHARMGCLPDSDLPCLWPVIFVGPGFWCVSRKRLPS